jgi:hypothetical protein
LLGPAMQKTVTHLHTNQHTKPMSETMLKTWSKLIIFHIQTLPSHREVTALSVFQNHEIWHTQQYTHLNFTCWWRGDSAMLGWFQSFSRCWRHL